MKIRVLSIAAIASLLQVPLALAQTPATPAEFPAPPSTPPNTPPSTTEPSVAPAAPAPSQPATVEADASVTAVAAPAGPVSAADSPPGLSPPSKPKPPPYSLPFQLRPVIPANVVRSDTALAYYEGANGETGSTVATTLLASMKVTDEFAPFVRFAAVSNSPPTGEPGSSLGNPLIGALYGLKLSPELRLALALGVALPLGNGGGNTPDPTRAAANGAGIRARSAMDNALFAVNDLVVFPGVGLAYIKSGFTVQIEATVLQLTRVRGEDKQPDSSRTNFTSGIHVGYFLIPQLSIGAELRHQRWLSTPKAVSATPNTRDTTTFAVGPRVHLKLAEKIWLRPGVAFAMGLDDPLQDSKYKIVQIDVPFVF